MVVEGLVQLHQQRYHQRGDYYGVSNILRDEPCEGWYLIQKHHLQDR